MKKRDFLLAGLFLFSASAFAQPGVDEPLRYPDDAKDIYFQGFEGSAKWDTIRLNTNPKRPTTLYTWLSKPVDSITQVTYYKRNYDGKATSNPEPGTNIYDGSKQWEIAGVRDTLMYLYDGVMRTDEKWPDDSALSFDRQTIVGHDGKSQQGQGAGPNGETGKEYGLDRFGVSGGTQFFRYWSGRSDGMVSGRTTNDDGDRYVADYRRNLFIRNIPIEDKSSYRVTVYVKPTVKAASGVKARIGVDLMRGYFHSEKPLMAQPTVKVGRYGSYVYLQSSYTFNDKNDYTDLETEKWNKITLMSYYMNDSIGDASPYLLSYYWADDWDWVTPIDKETGEVVAESADTATLKFIKQPDKYFVRLAFRSDSTEFDVDNLSITKSWIGGVEYFDDLIRVDFGYKTNLGELAQQALEQNKIAAVKVPGRYFKVWALWHDQTDPTQTFWEDVPILSAEYQGNGYMYMWTEDWPDEEGGGQRLLTEADSVLVTFFNPVDTAALTLRYTGDIYPNGLDSAWIADKNNRIVFDFHNEIGSVNPMVPYDPSDLTTAIMSLEQLPPVIQQWPEDGSFGFNPETREMTFKFSKNLSYVNGTMSEPDYAKTKVILKGSGVTEYWDIKDYGEDKSGLTTIVRPSEYSDPLQGDYVLSFEQITHLKSPDLSNSADYAKNNESFNYHFGNFDADATASVVAYSDWRNDVVDKEASNKRPIPKSVYIHEKYDAFQKGQGIEINGNKCGFYNGPKGTVSVNGVEIPDDGMFYLSNRDKTGGTTGNLYSIVDLTPGTYSISFKLGGHSTTDIPMVLKFYAMPKDGENYAVLGDGNDEGFAVLEAVADKTVLESGKKPAVNQGGSYSTTTAWKDGIETVSYTFSVAAAGKYVFEWVAPAMTMGDNYYGFCISNYWITTGGGLSFNSVARVNGAIATAAAKLAEAAATKYQSIAFNNLSAAKTAAEGFIPAKKAAFDNKPSEYEAEAKLVDAAVNALKVRMDTVDAFYNAYNAALDKFNTYDTAVALQPYKDLDAVIALGVLVNETYNEYDCSFKDPAKIAEDTKALNDAVKAVDDRKALNDKLDEAIANANSALTTYAKLSAYQVYSDLEDAIEAANQFDAIHCDDAELSSMISAVDDARMALVNRDYLADVATKRIKALDALAKKINASYGSDETEAAEIADRIAAIDFDDDELANIQKAAIKVEMYNKILASENVDSLDLTPFIKNYHFYAVVPGIVDRYDNSHNSVLPSKSGYDNEPYKVSANGMLQKVSHQYDDNKAVYILVLDEEYSNSVLPGWTIKSFDTGKGKHNMVTPDLRSYENLSKGKYVFDGLVTLDWNSKAELNGAVDMLPAGIYALGLSMKNPTHDSSNSVGTLTATVGGDNHQASLTQTKKTDEGVIKIDSLTITDGNMGINFVMTTGNGGAEVDNFNLLYLGTDPETDYEEAANSARSELDNLITVVDFAEAEIAEYEYYTLSWIKVENPQKGEVYIRKCGDVVEKVIFK